MSARRPHSSAAFYSTSPYSESRDNGRSGNWNPLTEDPHRVMLSARGQSSLGNYDSNGPPTSRKAWGNSGGNTSSPAEWSGGLRGGPEKFLDGEEIDRRMRDLKRENANLRRNNTQLQTRLRRSENDQSKLARELENSLKMKAISSAGSGGFRTDRGSQASIINGLKQQIHTLERDLRQSQEALSAYKQDTRYTRTIELEQETAVYFQEARRLSQMLTEADSYRAHLEEELATLRGRYGKVKGETKAEREQRKVLERALRGDTLVDSDSGLPPQRIDIHAMAQQLEQAKAELDATKARELGFTGEIAHLNRQISRLENDLGMEREKYSSTLKELQGLKAEYDEQTGAMKLSKEQVSVLQEEIDQSQAKCHALSDENRIVAQAKLDLESQLLDKEREIQSLQMDIAGLNARTSTLHEQIDGKEAMIEQVKGDRDGFAAETAERIAQLEAANEKSAGKIRELTAELEKVNEERMSEAAGAEARLLEEVQELKAANEELKTDLATQTQYTQDMVNSARELEDRLAGEETETKSLRGELDASRANARELQTEVDSLRRRLTKEGRKTHDLDEKVKALTAELDELKGVKGKGTQSQTLAPQPASPRYPSPAPPRPKALDKLKSDPDRKPSISDARTHAIIDAAHGDDLKLGAEVEDEAEKLEQQFGGGGGGGVSLMTYDEAADVIQTAYRGMRQRRKDRTRLSSEREKKIRDREEREKEKEKEKEEEEFVVESGPAVLEEDDTTDDADEAHRRAMMEAMMGDSDEEEDDEDAGAGAGPRELSLGEGEVKDDISDLGVDADEAHRRAMIEAMMGDSDEDEDEDEEKEEMKVEVEPRTENVFDADVNANANTDMSPSAQDDETDSAEAAHKASMMAALLGDDDDDGEEEDGDVTPRYDGDSTPRYDGSELGMGMGIVGSSHVEPVSVTHTEVKEGEGEGEVKSPRGKDKEKEKDRKRRHRRHKSEKEKEKVGEGGEGEQKEKDKEKERRRRRHRDKDKEKGEEKEKGEGGEGEEKDKEKEKEKKRRHRRRDKDKDKGEGEGEDEGGEKKEKEKRRHSRRRDKGEKGEGEKEKEGEDQEGSESKKSHSHHRHSSRSSRGHGHGHGRHHSHSRSRTRHSDTGDAGEGEGETLGEPRKDQDKLSPAAAVAARPRSESNDSLADLLDG